MCDIIFENTEGIYAEAAVQKVPLKTCYEKFRRVYKKTCTGISSTDKVKLCRSAAFLKTRPGRRIFLVTFAKFVSTSFL